MPFLRPAINVPGGYSPELGSTAIGALAAGMTAGTWAQLTVSNQGSILGVGPDTGSMLHFANTCCWNPLNQRIEIIGADHNYGATMRYARYDATSNQFVLVNVGGSVDSGAGPGHEFCGTALNPTTGELYYRHYGASGVSQFVVTKAALNGTALSTSIPLSPVTLMNITAGSCWWSGAFSGVGSQGAFFIVSMGNAQAGGAASDGQVMAYDPLAGTWPYSQTGAMPFLDDGSGGLSTAALCAYSVIKNCMAYAGGYYGPHRINRFNSNGTFTAMPAIPAGLEGRIQGGNLVADPVSGNFLLLSNAQLWELNPTGSGTWTQQTGSRVPPTGYRPGPSQTGTVNGVVSTPIPELGVVAYISQTSPGGGTFYLYKHA